MKQMAYCSFCNVDGLPEATNNSTYCPFCGKLIKEMQPAPTINLYGSDNSTSTSNPPPMSGGSNYSSYSSSPRYSSDSSKKSGGGAFFTTIILTLLAWYFLGSTVALIVFAIGVIYMLREIMGIIIILIAGVIGYFVAESIGINAIGGALIAGSVTAIITNKITKK